MKAFLKYCIVVSVILIVAIVETYSQTNEMTIHHKSTGQFVLDNYQNSISDSSQPNQIANFQEFNEYIKFIKILIDINHQIIAYLPLDVLTYEQTEFLLLYYNESKS